MPLARKFSSAGCSRPRFAIDLAINVSWTMSCRNMQNFEPCGVLDITSDWDGRKGTKACSVAALQVKFEPPPA